MTTSASTAVDRSLPNPFLGGIVPDAWRGATADVPEIHGDVYARCLAAVQTVRTRQQSSSVLIHGEQGSGKTHLLARLQRRLTDAETYPDLDDDWQIFVYLRMRTSSGRIWRKIRTELVTDLMRPMPDGLTQLDHVLAKRLAAHFDGHADLALWWDHHRNERMEELIDAWHEIAMQLSLRDDFTQVLECFIRGNHRRHVRAYLSGGLVSEAGFRHLFGNVDASHYAPDNEDDAFSAVKTLCHVAGPQIPIVFCFDQIEAIEVEDSNRKPVWYLARAVADLTDEAAVAAISCVLASFADDEIRSQDRARLVSGGQTALQRLDRDQMQQVIRSRVTAMQATADAAGDNAHWPFADDEAMFASRSTPRELLHAAATRFDELQGTVAAPPTTEKTPALAKVFDDRVDEAIRTQKPEDTDDLIASTLPNLLSILEPGWTTDYPTGPHNRKRDIELVLVGPDQEARVGVALCNQPSMTSLAAQLKRLIENREAFKLHKLVLIRDGRLPISPGAAATRKRIDQLTEDEGVLVRPNREVMAVLDAVRSLIADATCGDLTLDGRAVGISTVRQWLSNHLDAVTREWVDQFCRPSRPGWHDEATADDSDIDAVLEYLADCPVVSMDVMSRATGVAESRIVELGRVASDRLGIVSGEPTVIFRVASSTSSEEDVRSMQGSATR
ncbi:MAG: ATP-binding protein [Rhodopirellula sp. JB044]|uniref:ATP-binding protein n=1 Tax=Rhodopirellula sp. JB044 TaxID=3342844 RepID=UPI00370B659C